MINDAVQTDHESQPSDQYAQADHDATNRVAVGDVAGQGPTLTGPLNQGRCQLPLLVYRSANGGGFNRWMQHTEAAKGSRSVADEAAGPLLGRAEGADVGSLGEGRVAPADRAVV